MLTETDKIHEIRDAEKCVICHGKDGILIRTDGGNMVHPYCQHLIEHVEPK